MVRFTKKKKSCKGCEFYHRPFVPSEIRPGTKIALVGETPWDMEVQKDRPFAGPSGDKIEEFLEGNFDRTDCSLMNAVHCQPEEDPKTGAPGDVPLTVIRQCTEKFLIPELVALDPNVIVPMGGVALNALTKRSGITKARGFIFEQTLKHNGNEITAKVIPTFHPAYILRVPSLMPFSRSDFKQIRDQMDHRKIIHTARSVKYLSVLTEKDFKQVKKAVAKSKAIAVDLETTGLNWMKDDVTDIVVTPKKRRSYVIHLYKKFPKKNKSLHENKKVWNWLLKTFMSGKIVYGQNLPFDLRFAVKKFQSLLKKKLDLRKMKWRELLLLNVLLDENIPKDLKSLAHVQTDIRYSKKEIETQKEIDTEATKHAGRKKTTRVKLIKTASLKKRAKYAGKDGDATLQIGMNAVKRLKIEHNGVLWKLFQHEEMPVMKCLFKMALFGMHVDEDRIVKLRKMIKKKLKIIRHDMYKMAGKKFMIRSMPQLNRIMFKVLDITPSNDFRTKTGYSTGKEHLQWLIEHSPHPFLKLLQTYREYDKTKGTTLNGLLKWMDDDGLVHTEFQPWGTVTGRPSSKNPNVFNVPRDKEFSDGDVISVRWLFTARPGHVMIVADYSQIEFKLVAIMAAITRLIKRLRRGEDFHALTAREMYGMKMKKAEKIVGTGRWKGRKFSKKKIELWDYRRDRMRNNSKTFNFAMIFESGDDTLATGLKTTVKKAKDFKDRFFKLFPEIQRMRESCGHMALTDGHVQLINGRRRRFPKMRGTREQSRQRRQAFNMLPQGTAAYVTRGALIRICRRFEEEGIEGYPTNIVYDSVMAEVALKDVNRAGRIMAEEMLKKQKLLDDFIFTIKLGVGHDWQECERVAYPISKRSHYKEWKPKGR
jgi:uracil-DNA glycosylase family 4